MSDLTDEIDANSEAFRKKWLADLASNSRSLSTDERLKKSYRRITVIQALRVYLIQPHCSTEVSSFFVEAQNDALTSHVLASFGAWRSALNALRSCIEDIFGALYFKDHPVELELWQRGKFRLSFSGAVKYFESHPALTNTSDTLTGLTIIKEEYATLSKAVHGSAKNFRMTDDVAGILLWSDQLPKLGAWDTRHKRVIEGVSLLTICLFANRLQGTANTQLRSVLGLAIGTGRRSQLKTELHIHIDGP